MLDTIFIGMSGLTGYSKGLRVIGNNLTNVNTPGFKGSQLEFADLFYQQSAANGQTGLGSQSMQLGTGLNTLATTVNFKQGELHQTGNASDVAINGEGYFLLRNGDQLRYTRAGQFQFDKDGFLISQFSGARVAGLDDNSQVVDVSLDKLQTSSPKATSIVQFTGNISNTATADVVLDGVKVIDATGGEHVLKLTFKNNGATTPGSWAVTVAEGTTTVGSGSLQFSNGNMVAGSDKISINFAPANVAPFSMSLDFSNNVTSFAAGNTSSIAVKSQNGYGAGVLTKVSFDAAGLLTATYSNGQTAKGAHLALAQFDTTNDLSPSGGNEFISTNPQGAHLGTPQSGSFGTITSGAVEGSNVDMAEEFSNLIVMQRGYQASSHVISTANDMIQELFDMKGHR